MATMVARASKPPVAHRVIKDLNPPERILMGPGPSNIHPRVLQAMTKPLLHHLDPDFIHMMDEVAEMLQQVFGASGGFTLPVSGTGSAGMEAGLANLLEPGAVTAGWCQHLANLVET
ncbi:MAG: hypothetical protein HY680_04550 [Chloroflexi bacterium]|nr:hypothetical protein [Chloroflexota bacterium]